DPRNPTCRWRKPYARRDPAPSCARGSPYRRQRDPWFAWTAACGRRRKFLAVPPLRFGRAVAECRLAALGARRSSLCPRAGMGGRAPGMAVAGPFAVDGLRIETIARQQIGTRPDRDIRARRTLGRRRRARRHPRPDDA